MKRKLIDLLLNLARAIFKGKAPSIDEALQYADDAAALLGLFSRLDELPEAERKVLLEGKDVLIVTAGILLSEANGSRPTKAQKAMLQKELAEFIHADGAMVDGMTTS